MRALAKLRQHFDWPLFVGVLLLAALGVVNLYSATAATAANLARLQLYWVGIGMAKKPTVLMPSLLISSS